MPNLYIIASPIGNLKDITLRALEVFKSVDVIICEDTRVTRRLLKAYDIDKPLHTYHQHSNSESVNQLIGLIESGKDIAYVSDAGTPGIQDPGNQLISELVNRLTGQLVNFSIIPIPGPSAVTTLASVSGLPCDSFLFLGFIPKKKRRNKVLKEIVISERTVIFFESGHRILKTLEDLEGVLRRVQDYNLLRQIVVGRELTKRFETIYRGTIEEVLFKLEVSSMRGEFVIIAEGASQKIQKHS